MTEKTVAPDKSEKKPVSYLCTVGTSWPKDGRAERGERYAGPDKSLPWLIEHGYVVDENSDEAKRLLAELAKEGE